MIAGSVQVFSQVWPLSKWLGEGSGLRGVLIAWPAGIVTPGGPFTSFPLVLALHKAGAAVAVTVTYITAWSVTGLHRLLVWELPFPGPGIRRYPVPRLAAARDPGRPPRPSDRPPPSAEAGAGGGGAVAMTVLVVLGLMAAAFLALSVRIRPDRTAARAALCRAAGHPSGDRSLPPGPPRAAGFIGAMIPQETSGPMAWPGVGGGAGSRSPPSSAASFRAAPWSPTRLAIVDPEGRSGGPRDGRLPDGVVGLRPSPRAHTTKCHSWGRDFTAVRFAASLVLPPVSGGIAYVITDTGWLRGL